MKEVGGFDCPYRVQAGGYHEPFPWTACSKMPCLVLNENDICDIDAGEECRFIKKLLLPQP